MKSNRVHVMANTMVFGFGTIGTNTKILFERTEKCLLSAVKRTQNITVSYNLPRELYLISFTQYAHSMTVVRLFTCQSICYLLGYFIPLQFTAFILKVEPR